MDGGFFMEEKGRNVLEQYTFQVVRTMGTRGALLCDTNAGLKLLMPYAGRPETLEIEAAVLEAIASMRQVRVDTIVRNKEGQLMSADEDGTYYVVKDWYGGQNPIMNDSYDLQRGAALLGRLHNCFHQLGMEKLTENCHKLNTAISLDQLLDKRTNELKRIYNYIRKKSQKEEFERQVLACFAQQYDNATAAVNTLKQADYIELWQQKQKQGELCHGCYNYHNIYYGNDWQAVVRFEQMHFGMQIWDFYGYLRKAMEKNQWNKDLGLSLFRAYSAIHPVSAKEVEVLLALLRFPEKFWKILNYYMNTNKAWISEKNMEKLIKVCRQQKLKCEFTLFLERDVLR
jgi:spore coat protein I